MRVRDWAAVIATRVVVGPPLATSFSVALSAALFLGASPHRALAAERPKSIVDLADVDSSIFVDLAYFSTANFTGRRIEGYKANVCFLTTAAADALTIAQQRLRERGRKIGKDYSLLVYDCYRPQKAVNDFLRWAADPSDIAMKRDYYPNLNKPDLIRFNYIAPHSGHSRGSSVDVTVVERVPDGTIQPLPMGTRFDSFTEASHTAYSGVTADERINRDLLLAVMAPKFKNYSKEWWHFVLKTEQSTTSFDFDVVAGEGRVTPLVQTGTPLATTHDVPVQTKTEPQSGLPLLMAAGYSDHVVLPPPGSASPEEAVESTSPPCDDLDGCLRAIPTMARGEMGISKDAVRLADAINGYGAAAVPQLVSLLNAETPAVRQLAGYILRGQTGLRPEHLPALIDAVRRGDEWLPPAIARVGTPEAITFLVNELVRIKNASNQVGWAFHILGEKGVPSLIDLFRCKQSCDKSLMYSAAQILGELGDYASGAVPRLVAIATDRNVPTEGRVGSVFALGALGERAEAAVPALRGVADAQPEQFREPVDESLAHIGGTAGVAVLLARLKGKPDLITFRDLAELGVRAKSAGPALVEYLADEDLNAVLGAARALGYIRYEEASPQLAALLRRKDDWRIVWAAADSLGRLGAREAGPALELVAQKHWYPPVVEAAKKALAAISGKSEYVSRFVPTNFAFDFFSYEWAGRDAHIEGCPGGLEAKRGAPESPDLREAVAAGLTYKTSVVGYGVGGRHESHITQKPNAALRVDDGWLLGASRGEWGGELVHLGKHGKQSSILDDNIIGIFRLGTGIIAAGGLAHMGMNQGVAYRVVLGADGNYTAKPWLTLPGGPESARAQGDGRILINCHGGSVIISPDGSIELASCSRQ